jgi:hypothetical protein
MPVLTGNFAYAVGSIGYNQANNSLFITGSPFLPEGKLLSDNNRVAEISIPADNLLSTSATPTDLPSSSLLQDFQDIMEGHSLELLLDKTEYLQGQGARIGGLLVSGSSLIGTRYSLNVLAGDNVERTHFFSSTTLSTIGDFTGNILLDSDVLRRPHIMGGYLGDIPSEWQTAFAGDVLTGLGGLTSISRTSYGPAAMSFYKSIVLNTTDVDIRATPVNHIVYYDSNHRTLGEWDTSIPSNEYVSVSDEWRGVAFLGDNMDTVLFFGNHGSENCYGNPTAVLEELNTPVCGDGTQNCDCYDPLNLTHGNHSYPMKAWVWAYHAQDLADVKSGLLDVWEPIPTVWELPVQTLTWDGVNERTMSIQGAAYDESTNRLYISQAKIDGAGNYAPLIHVYQITNQVGGALHQGSGTGSVSFGSGTGTFTIQ